MLLNAQNKILTWFEHPSIKSKLFIKQIPLKLYSFIKIDINKKCIQAFYL